jgi:hypothetical protein
MPALHVLLWHACLDNNSLPDQHVPVAQEDFEAEHISSDAHLGRALDEK